VIVFIDSNIPMYVGGRAALHRFDMARDVYDSFVAMCPNVHSVTLADTNRARDLLVEHRLPARDAVHAGVMLNRGIEWIATFDRAFDRVSGIRRFVLT
jgi:predicted nucleic acid-binding protein